MVLWIILWRVTGKLFLKRDVAIECFKSDFQCCEHHKQNSIHLHYTEVEAGILETDVSKSEQIKVLHG